jgi:hypothetical protein
VGPEIPQERQLVHLVVENARGGLHCWPLWRRYPEDPDLVADAAIDLAGGNRDHHNADTDDPGRWSLPTGAPIGPSSWRATMGTEGFE